MSGFVDQLLGVSAVWVYVCVALLVFLEDAIFIGFVLPGETAAVVGGVAASFGHVNVVAMAAIVVVAAIVGDSVGYEVGKHVGPRMLERPIIAHRRARLDAAQNYLARRGGSAVFLGRFVAFLRAVMPALAGMSRMPYRRFLAYNAAGGLVWGIGFVLLGYLAGSSYAAVANTVGHTTALVVAAVAVVAVVVWRIRARRHTHVTGSGSGPQQSGGR
ncbi:DedA family protein [Prescottella agglutinans]|uniref:Membrane-associated protein n=1 Tax=Prescottella agglutinans TaxID=1644129 RepID=A0ABT6MF34_9NOCA|nr:DedA family protein [Prescottella agglutinans]MDH6282930.1 membrane-associated protein [Prescottella agglutinans]